MIAPTRQTAVGMAEIRVAHADDGHLVAHGLGSCVIVCAWDPRARVAGMAHVVQPQSPASAPADSARYADLAVPALLDRMRAAGADPARLVVKLAGGAAVLRPTAGSAGDSLGTLNVRAVEAVLNRAGLRAAAADVGGAHGRTAALDPATGRLHVKTLGLGECSL